VKIPKAAIRTTWKADFLLELSITLVALAFLMREALFAVVAAGILLALASLGLIFHRRLTVLRRELHVAQHMSKTRMLLGDNVEGELTIRNGSNLAAQILAVQPIIEKVLNFRLSSFSSFGGLLPPGATHASEFTITPAASGRFQMSGFTLTFTDARHLFTGEAGYAQAEWVEVHPATRRQVTLTPLRLYGGSLDIFRKAPTGADYAGIRQYASGDEYHRVEWKATARLRTLMVKEFHPESQTALQIIIDAGGSMRRRSYVGTRLDEALAVAELLTESAAASRTPVGIYVHDENELLKVMKPAIPIEQVPRLRELSLALQAKNERGKPSASLFPPRTFPARSVMPSGGRVAAFIRLLRARLGMAHRHTGAYKALREAAQIGGAGMVIVLTDLETNAETLLEAASARQKRGAGTIIAQIGAAWRLSDDQELAYAEYQRNSRILRQMERLDLTVFDLRPERLVEAIAQEIGKTLAVASVHR
jgi:uncharacterized protein (DUF58 family)